MDRPYPAYTGSEPYIFCELLSQGCVSRLSRTNQASRSGLLVWYDEGIDTGTEWRGEISKAMGNAHFFVYFVTPASAKSQNCLKEVNFAEKQNLSTMAIHLEVTELPGSLDLGVSDRQAFLKYEMPISEYQQKRKALISSYLDHGPAQLAVADRLDVYLPL